MTPASDWAMPKTPERVMGRGAAYQSGGQVQGEGDPAHAKAEAGEASGLTSPAEATTVAALYVDPNGVYANLPNVEVWDEARDARLYEGPWPVVAHPPCRAWSLMGQCRPEIVRGEDGGDEGCFEAALRAVQTFGGVIEHPARSRAWSYFGLPRPGAAGWYGKLFGIGSWEVGRFGEGWACEVDQRWYGHEARKPTWLYYVGGIPLELRWGRGPKGEKSVGRSWGQGRSHLRARTPVEFRDVLLEMARSASKVRESCGLR